MFQILKRIRESKFSRNVAIVATGTAGAQVITMAFAPLVTRLYGPEAFGMLGTFMAVLAVMTPIAALTYPIAIVLPRSDHDAIKIAKLSAGIAVIVASLAAVIIFTWGGWLAKTLDIESVGRFFMIIPLFMIFSALQQIFTQLLIRRKRFSITARLSILQSLMVNLANTGVGLYIPVGAALIAVVTASQAIYAIILGINVQNKWATDRARSPKSLWEVAKTYKDFPIYRAPQVTLNALSQSLPIIMLASFSGPAAAGFYTLGKTVVGMPSTLIGQSVASVFYPRITEAVHAGEDLYKLLTRATMTMAIVGIFPFSLIILLGPWIFSLVFGEKWAMAGEYARWLSFWLYFAFLNRPTVAAIPSLGLQKFFLLYEISSVAFRVFAIIVGIAVFESDIYAIGFFSFTGVFLNAFLICYTLRGTLARK